MSLGLAEIDRLRPYLVACARRYFRALSRLGIDADDVAQETIIYAYEERRAFDPARGSLKSWLFQMMRSWYWAECDFQRIDRRYPR